MSDVVPEDLLRNWRRRFSAHSYGDPAAARAAYEDAATRATSLPQQRYLNAKAAQLTA